MKEQHHEGDRPGHLRLGRRARNARDRAAGSGRARRAVRRRGGRSRPQRLAHHDRPARRWRGCSSACVPPRSASGAARPPEPSSRSGRRSRGSPWATPSSAPRPAPTPSSRSLPRTGSPTVPANVDAAQAASLPISGAAAWFAVEAARIEPGHRILVLGASGGVGVFAVQLAKAAGAHVTGTASTGKLEVVRAAGADEVLDHSAGDVVDGSIVYDAIIDIGGNRPLGKLRRALTRRGILAIVGGEDGRGRVLGGFQRQMFSGVDLGIRAAAARRRDVERGPGSARSGACCRGGRGARAADRARVPAGRGRRCAPGARGASPSAARSSCVSPRRVPGPADRGSGQPVLLRVKL